MGNSWDLVIENEKLVYYFVNKNKQFWMNHIDRDDMEQEMLLAMQRAAETYDPDKGTFPGYAWKCMRNRAITMVGTRIRKFNDLPMDPMAYEGRAEGDQRWAFADHKMAEAADPTADFEDDILNRVAAEQVAAAVKANMHILTDNEQIVLDLYFTEGLRDFEIADRLGVTRQRIGKLRENALAKMRKVVVDG